MYWNGSDTAGGPDAPARTSRSTNARGSSLGLPRRLLKGLLPFAALVSAAAAPAADPRDDPSARDLVRLVRWFEGTWDNQEQVWFETEGRAQVPEAERHERVHAVHRRIELPAFGAIVFYVEEYLGDDPSKVFRQRLVTFESARARGVRMRQGLFRDPGAVRGAHLDPARLRALQPGDLTWIEGCEVLWRPEADQYVGGMDGRACIFREGAARRWSQHDLVLSATKYWRTDRSFELASGRLLAGHPTGVPHKLHRAKVFECDVDFYARSYLEGTSPGDRRYERQRLHSQGGTLRLARGDGRVFQLRLRDKEYPYYTQRADFMFLSIREGEQPFAGYSLHDPDAAFIGLNLGWIAVACERVEPPQRAGDQAASRSAGVAP
jgi:hypothetical protein